MGGKNSPHEEMDKTFQLRVDSKNLAPTPLTFIPSLSHTHFFLSLKHFVSRLQKPSWFKLFY